MFEMSIIAVGGWRRHDLTVAGNASGKKGGPLAAGLRVHTGIYGRALK